MDTSVSGRDECGRDTSVSGRDEPEWKCADRRR